MIVNSLSHSSETFDQRLGRELHRSLSLWEEPVPSTEASSPLQLLSQTVMLANLVEMLERRDQTVYMLDMFAWGRAFIAKILHDLRGAACGPKGSDGKPGEKSHDTLAALAPLIAQKFDVSSPTAAALAALSLIALGKATKNAFCEMTDEKVLQALSKT